MIGKVITGKSFGGCVRYVVQKHDAVILEAAGVRMQQVNQIINDFNLQRKFNPDLGQAVGHLVLSWSIEDTEKLNDEVMLIMAKEYLRRMKITDTQYLIVKHQDTEHPHIHIIYNRVNNEGKTIPDNFQKDRNVRVTRDMTLKYGFYMSPGKEDVNREQLRGADKVKYELFDAIKSAGKQVRDLHELKAALARQGIGMHFKYRSGTEEIQGISFSKGEYRFKGSEIDRSLSYAKLTQSMAAQLPQQDKSLADQLREAMQTAEAAKGTTEAGLQINDFQLEPEPNFLNIDPGFDINITDDIDDEAIHGRNRHRKRQARTNTR